MDVEYSYTGTHQRQPPRRGSFRLSHEGGSLSVASAIDIVPKLTSEEACEHEHEHELDLDRSVRAKPTGASSLSLSRSLSRSSPPPRRSLFPNADSRSAISAGRALLNRPAAAQASSAQQASSSSGSGCSPFTASAAASPLRRLRTEPAQLKSCLSSSNVLSARTNPSSSSSSSSSSQANRNRNEEFHLKTTMKRNVSFSHLRIREYAITLGDNPSVSSGPPVTLDWAYDPHEKTAPVEAFEAVRIRRPGSRLALSDRQRSRLLAGSLRGPGIVGSDEMAAVLRDVAAARLERTVSRNEFLEERRAAAAAAVAKESTRIGAGRAAMRARRMAGIRSGQ